MVTKIPSAPLHAFSQICTVIMVMDVAMNVCNQIRRIIGQPTGRRSRELWFPNTLRKMSLAKQERPSGAEAGSIFCVLAARVKLVPFPAYFFRSRRERSPRQVRRAQLHFDRNR